MKTFLIWTVALLIMCPMAQAKNIFVAIDGNDLLDGSTEALAKATIQRAINDANSGDTITLLPGTYSGTGNRDIYVPAKDIVIQSSEPNDPISAARTVIDCGGHLAMVKKISTPASTIEINGISFAGGKYTSILDFYHATVRISNCRFFEHTAQNVITCTFGSLIMDRCQIQKCSAFSSSIFLLKIADANVVLTNSKLLSNEIDQYACGVYMSGNLSTGKYEIRNCLVTSGPALNSLNFETCINMGGIVNVTNCTLPRGIYSRNVNVNVRNSILWPGSISASSTDSFNILYSDVYSPDATNLWAEPKYAADSKYLLSASSPCIDKGVVTDVAADIDALPRPADGNSSGTAEYDIGAAEYDPAAIVMYAEQSIISGKTYSGIPQEEVGKIILRKLGTGNCRFSAWAGNTWLKAEYGQGVLNDNVEIKILADSTELATGKYYSFIVVESEDADNAKIVIPVILTVGNGRIVPDQYATIQAAIDAATDGDCVIIRPGTYSGTGNSSIHLNGKKITVRSENPRDPGVVANTILSGPRGTCFYFYNQETNNTVIEGLTLSDFWEAINCSSSSPTIRDCVITGCYGQAIYLKSSSPIIERCRFENNTGKVISMESGINLFMRDCIIKDNVGVNTDLLWLPCEGYIENCVFMNNRWSDNISYNSVIAGCNYDNIKVFKISNCTFFNNLARGRIIRPEGDLEITNCIMWDDDMAELPVTTLIKAKNCCIKGGYTGENIISVWPRFAFDDNCRLMAGSPCIDAGSNDVNMAADLAGNARSIDGNSDGERTVDIGAYEFVNGNEPAVSLIDGTYFETYENGFEPRPLKMLIRNLGRNKAKFIITSDADWLSTEPNVIELDKNVMTVNILANPAGLAAGDYLGTLVISDANGGGKAEVKTRLRIANARHVPAQYATIKATLAAAQNGDYVILEPGRYSGTDNSYLDITDKKVTICSTDPFDSNDSARAVIDFDANSANKIQLYSSAYLSSDVKLLGLGFENCTNATAAITVFGSKLVADNCVFKNNNGTRVLYMLGGLVGLNKCRFENNKGEAAAWAEDCTGQITNCFFMKNETTKAALNLGYPGNWRLEHNTIAENSGQGIIPASSFDMLYCTITGNSNGGISMIATTVGMIENCIIWGNGVYNLKLNDYSCTHNTKVQFCDIGGGAAGLGNFDADPCFVSAAAGDYRLKTEGWRWDGYWTWDEATSRCVDAGNPGTMMGDEPVFCSADPYGRIGKNLRVDIGAYGGTGEGAMPYVGDVLLPDITNDRLVNLADYAAIAGSREELILDIPGDLNRDSYIDWIDMAWICQQWLEGTR